jgi:hypothetical protein
MEKKVTTHITKGLIISLVMIVMDLVSGFANFKFEVWYRWIPSLVLLAALIWACVSYGAQMEHKVTFGNVFVHGFKASSVTACILVIYSLLSVYLIFPETRDQATELARKSMEQKNLSPEAVEQGLEISRRLFLPSVLAGAILGTLLVGVIASLIGAAVTKKRPPSLFESQT